MAQVDPGARLEVIAAKAMARREAGRKVHAEAVASRAVDVEQRRAELRAAMPVVAGVVDAFRAVGVEVRVLAAAEGGRVVGSGEERKRLGVDGDG